MDYNTGILFGRVTKINLYDGSVTVRLERSFIEKIPELGSVFVEIEGRPVPFFVSEYDYPGAETMKIVFEDYSSPDKIKIFKDCRVFLTSTVEEGDRGSEFTDILGYTIIDQDKIIVGKVEDVIQNPGQIMMEVSSPSKKEILIPLHDDLILNVDPDKKIIEMNIPEGLRELN
jgi:16S rRNA processing protein RimM